MASARWFVTGLAAAACAACAGSPADAEQRRTFEWGPYALAPGQEIVDQCSSASLGNDRELFVSSVELVAGAGFHHSNWFVVPDGVFAGPDGTWRCADRQFDQVSAAVAGNVLFAQSTQSTHELQQFAPGAAIRVAPHSKIVGDTHLLNAGDAAEQAPLALTIVTIPAARVTTLLHGMSFENESLALPPHRASRFTTECDLATEFRNRGQPDPTFALHYALAHYHRLGTGLTLDAVRADGTSTPIFSTAGRVGDALGGALAPPFSFAGYAKLRMSCAFDNLRLPRFSGQLSYAASASLRRSASASFGGL